MKIMHFICGPGAGGAEIFVKDMAHEMARLGHSIHIVFLQTAIESNRDENFGKRFLRELDASGITYDFIGIASRRNPLLGFIKTRKIVKSYSPEIVHVHLYWPLLFLLFIQGFPVVFTKHSIQLGAPAFLVKLMLARVSAFIAICEACRSKFEGIAGPKIIRIDNGTSFRLNICPRSSDPKSVNLLYVGRLFPVKNIDMLLRCCARIRHLDFHLTVAGEGPELDTLQMTAMNERIANKVSFIGNVDNISELMAQADVFLLSSISEGLPISLIEASLSGLPCIVTDVGGCGEVIEKCRNGFVVPALDEYSYSQRLKLLIEDSALREQLSHNASFFSSYYSIKRVVDQHIELYEKVS